MQELLNSYKSRKNEIKKRLKEFEFVWLGTDRKIFSELCFCLCTRQSSARVCDSAVSKLELSGLLFNGNEKEIEQNLTGIRFSGNKAKYIIIARNFFTEGKRLVIKKRLKQLDKRGVIFMREWLVKNVKGLGYKEASHFLRNIGLGKSFAILDRHILKNLKRYGVIETIPKTLTKKRYLEIEKNMKEFSKKIGIRIDELDLLFWSEETGEVFK